ncbi:hypothetical protein ATY79_19660 [Rhizobium sp. R693]|nr:hypothetical protein ATY79_19660 [Rhizobium sp. R693]
MSQDRNVALDAIPFVTCMLRKLTPCEFRGFASDVEAGPIVWAGRLPIAVSRRIRTAQTAGRCQANGLKPGADAHANRVIRYCKQSEGCGAVTVPTARTRNV